MVKLRYIDIKSNESEWHQVPRWVCGLLSTSISHQNADAKDRNAIENKDKMKNIYY